MALRTFVSFDAEFLVNGHPPGEELAGYVFQMLLDAGLHPQRPEEREGWAWTVWSEREFTRVEIIVGKIAGKPRQWLITFDGHVSMARGLAVGGNADERREEALQPFCYALDRAFKSDHSFHNIRWYTQEEYDSGGNEWHDTP